MNANTDSVAELARLRAENNDLRTRLQQLEDANSPAFADSGYYTYRHPLDDAAGYQARLDEIREQIKQFIRDGDAVETSPGFIYDNSLAKGKKMTADLSKLMLRAYNAEAENCVRYVRAGNLDAAVTRLKKSAASIAKLGAMMSMHVADDYHALRVDELTLTADYLMKVKEEREAAREERERLREERKAREELESERARLTKQRQHYLNVLTAMAANSDDERREIEAKLAEVDDAIERNDYRIANIRAGYVYVISNLGAFGPGMVKIGLTRRLDPMDRVRELGDASVPFGFDVHALFFSEDAVSVESELHSRFADRRVNRVNLRREFFYTTPHEVREQLADITGNLLEFVAEPEAEQFRLSRTLAGDLTA